MNCDELQQLTALGALGALDGADVARLRERLDDDPAARLELARFCEVAAALAGGVVPRRPSPAVRSRVLERIRRTPQQPRGSSAVGSERVPGPPAAPPAAETGSPAGISFLSKDLPWLPAPIPGARFKVLSAGPSQAHVMLMIELGPGALYPGHDHVGTEDMYVLTGDLQSEGRSLGPGDFLHAEPGSHHQDLRSIGGCTALMVVPRASVEELLPAQP